MSVKWGLPCNKISVIFWSESSCRLVAISFNLSNKVFLIRVWQCKKNWDVDSFSELQIHFGFTQCLNLWLYLCSFRWLSPSLRIGSWILNTELGTGLISWIKCFLKVVWEELQIFISKLLHSVMVQGKKDDSNVPTIFWYVVISSVLVWWKCVVLLINLNDRLKTCVFYIVKCT